MKERDDFVNGYVISVIGMIVGLLCVLEAAQYSSYAWRLLPIGAVLLTICHLMNVAVWQDVSHKSGSIRLGHKKRSA